MAAQFTLPPTVLDLLEEGPDRTGTSRSWEALVRLRSGEKPPSLHGWEWSALERLWDKARQRDGGRPDPVDQLRKLMANLPRSPDAPVALDDARIQKIEAFVERLDARGEPAAVRDFFDFRPDPGDPGFEEVCWKGTEDFLAPIHRTAANEPSPTKQEYDELRSGAGGVIASLLCERRLMKRILRAAWASLSPEERERLNVAGGSAFP
jgi:hypothetical protein